MKPGKDYWEKADQWIGTLLQRACIGFLMALIVLVSASVVVRFLPLASMGWADELVELAFAWLVFLGAAALFRNRSHFRVDLLPMKLGRSKAGLRLEIGLACLALGFFLVFASEGGWLSFRATDRSPILELPRYLWYIVMPLSGVITIVYLLRDIRGFWKGRS